MRRIKLSLRALGWLVGGLLRGFDWRLAGEFKESMQHSELFGELLAKWPMRAGGRWGGCQPIAQGIKGCIDGGSLGPVGQIGRLNDSSGQTARWCGGHSSRQFAAGVLERLATRFGSEWFWCNPPLRLNARLKVRHALSFLGWQDHIHKRPVPRIQPRRGPQRLASGCYGQAMASVTVKRRQLWPHSSPSRRGLRAWVCLGLSRLQGHLIQIRLQCAQSAQGPFSNGINCVSGNGRSCGQISNHKSIAPVGRLRLLKGSQVKRQPRMAGSNQIVTHFPQ